MARLTIDDLPAVLQRDIVTYDKRFQEWKQLCSIMDRIDKAIKKYMIDNKVEFIETDALTLKMTQQIRHQLDQSLIENIDDYKVKKVVNTCSVFPKEMSPDPVENGDEPPRQRARRQ